MKIKDSIKDGVAVIELSGKIMGGDSATLFHGKLHEYLEAGSKMFVIDMEGVVWSNSVGLGMLVAALAAVTKVEGRLALANVTNIRDLLAMTQLLKIFEVFDSRAEALSALS